MWHRKIFTKIGAIALSFATASPALAESGKIATCRIESEGTVAFAGPCRFQPEAGNGSFSLSARSGDGPIYGEILAITVSVIRPGVADVRGLTRAGINSRWGEARREARDRACWAGSDFRICAR